MPNVKSGKFIPREHLNTEFYTRLRIQAVWFQWQYRKKQVSVICGTKKRPQESLRYDAIGSQRLTHNNRSILKTIFFITDKAKLIKTNLDDVIIGQLLSANFVAI